MVRLLLVCSVQLGVVCSADNDSSYHNGGFTETFELSRWPDFHVNTCYDSHAVVMVLFLKIDMLLVINITLCY